MTIIRKFFFAVFLATLMSTCSVSQAHVLDGAKEWNGHYYKIFQMQMTWNDAKSFCESMGGHLATAETQAENEMLKTLVVKGANGQGKYYWIGGYETKQGIWKWITGKTIADYFDWVEYRSSFYGSYGEHKIRMYSSKDGKWDAGVTSSQYEFICEWESYDNAHESNM